MGFTRGLPWVISSRISPEGANRYGENRLRTLEPDRPRISSPFRAKRLFPLTQGKPWYVFSAGHTKVSAIWSLPICGPSGQKSIAQGLPGFTLG